MITLNDTEKSHVATGYDRHIPLEGAYNVRDLGGYPSRFGGNVRWGRLLRADGVVHAHE